MAHFPLSVQYIQLRGVKLYLASSSFSHLDSTPSWYLPLNSQIHVFPVTHETLRSNNVYSGAAALEVSTSPTYGP